MRYDNLRAFEKHLEGASPHHFSPLYFILGKDAFECQEAIQLLLGTLLPSQQMKELALSTCDGARVEEGELETILYSPSFLTTFQVIWIQQADRLKKSTLEKLEKFLTHLPPSQYLILSAPHWAKTSSFYKVVEKEGIILEFVEVKSWEKEKKLAEWVNKQVAARRQLISYPVCQSFVRRVGTDQACLAQELEKLLCYCGEKKEITQQDVEAICTWQPMDSAWQLGEALFRRDAASAFQVMQALLMDGQPLLPLLRQIRFQFQTDYQVCLLLSQGKQGHEITQEFPYMKGKILETHLRQAQQYGLDAFKKGLLALDATESRIKNSFADEKILIELLIMQLTT